jgi:hypothetical protein
MLLRRDRRIFARLDWNRRLLPCPDDPRDPSNVRSRQLQSVAAGTEVSELDIRARGSQQKAWDGPPGQGLDDNPVTGFRRFSNRRYESIALTIGGLQTAVGNRKGKLCATDVR